MKEVEGLRVLLVEDEPLVAMFLEDTLEEMGCVVAGIAASAHEASLMICEVDFDAAILDINLNRDRSITIADRLKQDGIPFIFATGYGPAGVPKHLADVPLLSKPFTDMDLKKVLAKAMRRDAPNS